MSIQRRLQGCLAAGLALSLPLTAVSIAVPQSRQHIAVAADDASQSQPSTVNAIDLIQENETIRMVVYLSGDSEPEVLLTQTDTEWVGTVANATLDLPDGSQEYTEENPIEGVRQIAAIQVDDSTVEIRLTGGTQVPEGLLSSRSSGQVMFEFAGLAGSSTNANAAHPDLNAPDIQPDEILASSLPATASDENTNTASATDVPLPDAGEPLATSEVSESPPDLPDTTDMGGDQEVLLEGTSPTAPVETAAVPSPNTSAQTDSGAYLDNGLLSPIDTYLNRSSSNPAVPYPIPSNGSTNDLNSTGGDRIAAATPSPDRNSSTPCPIPQGGP